MAAAIDDAATEAATLSEPITKCRYRGDVRRLNALSESRMLKDGPASAAARHRQAHVRVKLLSDGVRADMALLPSVATAVRSLQQRAGITETIEAYVFDEGSVNAFVTRGRGRVLVGLSSGCVNALTQREIEFVIGHELGHLAFGHVDIETPHLNDPAQGATRSGMALKAWQRAAEISADRAGLICCGSLAIATSAFFKTLCGVRVAEGSIDPRAFAAQWDDLEKELVAAGGSDEWQVSHPVPPLRMRAMALYWDALAARAVPGVAVDTGAPDAVDDEVERLLAMMDPLAREDAQAADPILVDFLLWGGLAMALADGAASGPEMARLREVLPAARLSSALGAAASVEDCLARFREALAARHGKLKAMEIHRIMEGLLTIAHADGPASAKELAAFRGIGDLLGVGTRACDLLIERYEGGSHAGR